MPEEKRRKVTLTKAERDSPPGRELVAMLLDLSDDGQVTREEMNRLREWLEVDRGIDFAACAFLYEIVDTIAADGEITDDELDSLMPANERVLPIDARNIARDKRRQHRAAQRAATVAARAAARAELDATRERTRPLHRGDFIVAGVRFSERREACEALDVGDGIILEREPDNRHDKNAILIFDTDGNELGYVPRFEASEMAPLLDAGAACEATVKKLLETREGITLPVVVSVLRWQCVTDAAPSISPPISAYYRPSISSPNISPPSSHSSPAVASTETPGPSLRRPAPSVVQQETTGRGYSLFLLLIVLVLLLFAVLALRS